MLNEMTVQTWVERMLGSAGVHAHFRANLTQNRQDTDRPQTGQGQTLVEQQGKELPME
jgi:hypothetical protein